MHNIGIEMAPLFIGPMPVDEFLNEFLPVASIPSYSESYSSTFARFQKGAFQEVLKLRLEMNAYGPFVSQL
jgi:hypothetical protein